MGGLFSSLSTQLFRAVVLSAGLPATAFVLGFMTLLEPRLPDTWVALRIPETVEPEWKTALAVVSVVLIAALLSALNGPIIRLLEGYPFEDSALGRRLADRHRLRAEEAESWRRGARLVLKGIAREEAANEASLAAARFPSLYRLWNDVGQELAAVYPEPESTLPTRLGNCIRAFEYYPRHAYGIYGVTLWPRLTAVVPESYKSEIAEAKQPFDLMVNSAVVSAGLGAILLAAGLTWPEHNGASPRAWLEWGGLLAVLLVLAYAFYLLALPRAMAWGNTVKSAFDLYRWDLLEKLRVDARPATMEEERELWRRIGGHMLFGRLTTSRPLDYDASPGSGEHQASEPVSGEARSRIP